MAIATYLFLAAVAYVVARLWLVSPENRDEHAPMSLLLVSVGFVAWAGLSQVIGVSIVGLGAPVSYSIPDDYFAPGPIGWSALAIAVMGILSPILITPFFARGARA